MAWYWIVLLVLAGLFGVTFLTYLSNADMKLVAKIYDKLLAYHDKQKKEEKL